MPYSLRSAAATLSNLTRNVNGIDIAKENEIIKELLKNYQNSIWKKEGYALIFSTFLLKQAFYKMGFSVIDDKKEQGILKAFYFLYVRPNYHFFIPPREREQAIFYRKFLLENNSIRRQEYYSRVYVAEDQHTKPIQVPINKSKPKIKQ